MAIEASEWIYLDGEWVAWDEANVHITAHALHYGSSVFEGVRAYKTQTSTAIFRLEPHTRRLMDSARLLHMQLGDYTQEHLQQLQIEAVQKNQLESCYIRPLIFRGGGTLGLNPVDAPVQVAIFAIKWGAYLGEEAIEQGVDAVVSSWRRFNANTSMPLGKIGGQYTTSQLVSMEARSAGFGEGIMLDERGLVCEGAGENLFAVFGDRILTPGIYNSVLSGITRDSVITLARDKGYEVASEPISRDMLYLADELFMTGTAAEITPVRSVDRLPIGNGSRGKVTKELQQEFFGILNGTIKDRHSWLTPVPMNENKPTAATAGATS